MHHILQAQCVHRSPNLQACTSFVKHGPHYVCRMDLAHSVGFLTHKLPSCSPVLATELLHASLTSGKLPGKAWHCAHSRHITMSPRSNDPAG